MLPVPVLVLVEFSWQGSQLLIKLAALLCLAALGRQHLLDLKKEVFVLHNSDIASYLPSNRSIPKHVQERLVLGLRGFVHPGFSHILTCISVNRASRVVADGVR